MKTSIKIFVSFVLSVSTKLSLAQSPTPNTQNPMPIDSATLYLTGTFKQYNPQRAFQINMQNAIAGNAKAMNAVALQYTKGLGVDSNSNLAAYWFNQAATNGYTKALVNLGMLHKHKATDSSGYAIACNYFNQALQANEPSSYFAMGYMYYKGLGCTQSYTNALQLFDQGIAINQANCMYFKGLCYKYGYGVTTNSDSALYYIDSAAHLGYKQANAELNNSSASSAALRSLRENQTTTLNNEQPTHETYNRIEKNNNTININGTYTGTLNQYDYSGKKLLSQILITLQLSTNNNIVKGSLQLNNSDPIPLQAIQQGNQLIFSQTAVVANKEATITNNKTPLRSLPSLRSLRETKLIFKSATFSPTTNEASLLLFNTYTHETYKPINLKLTQKENTQNITKDQNPTPKDLAIFPNPTTGTFTITFNLPKTSTVKLNIYNQQGQIVYTKIIEQLQAGKQTIPIEFSNPLSGGRGATAGIYTLKLTTNLLTQTTAFIYEK